MGKYFKPFLFIIITLLAFNSCKSTLNSGISIAPYQENKKTEIVIFYLAHQDDDVFISSRISKHIKTGDNVYVVYTCLSYQRGERYKQKRINEAEKALRHLNVSKNNIIYLGFPDMESHKHLNDLIGATDSLFKVIQPNIVYTSAYEGGNIDHDVANYTISQLLFKQGYGFKAYEFPEYSGYNTHWKFKYRNYPDSQKTYVSKLSLAEYKKVAKHWDFYRSQKYPVNFLMALTSGKKTIF